MIYLASPFFNDEERKNLTFAENTLFARGLDVYSPRLHEDRDDSNITPEWCEETFLKDKTAIDRADAVCMLYYGNYSDSGTAWEAGYANGLGKPVIAVHIGGDSNLMVHVSARANIALKDLETYDFEALPEIKFTGKAF